MRYSSRQVSVDLTDEQRETLRQLRDRRFVGNVGNAGTQQARILDAISKTLAQQGYAPISVDADTGVVEAERNTVLVPKWRQIARGVLKARIGGLPGRPDHERMAAIITVRTVDGKQELLVRVRFDRTVWDSNGDARTETVIQKDVYDGFFGALEVAVRAN